MDALNSPQVVVALAFIVLVALITVAAILRYEAQDVLKIWGGLSAIVGVMAGSITTFFFTKPLQEQAEKQAQVAQQQLSVVQAKASEAQVKLDEIRPVLYSRNTELEKLLEQWQTGQTPAAGKASVALQNDLKRRRELLKSFEGAQKDLSAVAHLPPPLPGDEP